MLLNMSRNITFNLSHQLYSGSCKKICAETRNEGTLFCLISGLRYHSLCGSTQVGLGVRPLVLAEFLLCVRSRTSKLFRTFPEMSIDKALNIGRVQVLPMCRQNVDSNETIVMLQPYELRHYTLSNVTEVRRLEIVPNTL